MIEKLLEDWLDSASEKSYQAGFVQMLGGLGYRVVHSTRHCALEYGKDIIAIDPDGIPCAYQLKGKPGGRLGLNEFREDIQNQLIQLMSQPIIFPGINPDVPHRSYLVCNGYFEEEVQRAIDDLNRSGLRSSVELIGRGQLFEWAKTLGSNLWPSELEKVRELLEIFLHDGHDILPIKKLASILESVLSLRPTDKILRASELRRAVTSAALLTGIATRHFASESNHYAITSAWCLFMVSAIASCARSNKPIQGPIKESLTNAESSIKDSLVGLWNEAMSNKHLVEGDIFADTEIYRWRYTLLCSLFSVLWFFPGETQEDNDRRNAIAEWLKRPHEYLLLWGEGAVPSLLALLLLLRRIDATMRPDYELANLFVSVITSNQSKSKDTLPDPYYDFEVVGRLRFGLSSNEYTSNLKEESFNDMSYTAELLLHLLARARLKTPCRSNWPKFNRINHKKFIPANTWQYGLLYCHEGTEVTRQYPPEYTWKKLCEDASSESCDYLPEELKAKPHLLLLWVIIAPHRLTSDIGRILAATLPNQQ